MRTAHGFEDELKYCHAVYCCCLSIQKKRVAGAVRYPIETVLRLEQKCRTQIFYTIIYCSTDLTPYDTSVETNLGLSFVAWEEIGSAMNCCKITPNDIPVLSTLTSNSWCSLPTNRRQQQQKTGQKRQKWQKQQTTKTAKQQTTKTIKTIIDKSDEKTTINDHCISYWSRTTTSRNKPESKSCTWARGWTARRFSGSRAAGSPCGRPWWRGPPTRRPTGACPAPSGSCPHRTCHSTPIDEKDEGEDCASRSSQRFTASEYEEKRGRGGRHGKWGGGGGGHVWPLFREGGTYLGGTGWRGFPFLV